MYSVHCTLYTVHCTLYTLHCTGYSPMCDYLSVSFICTFIQEDYVIICAFIMYTFLTIDMSPDGQL